MPEGPVLTVGLTGNVASGKSTVARIWREAGVPVVSADDLARQVVEPGTDGLAEVVALFGDGVLADDGTLDRARLRDRVFRDDEARRRLESILHPRIWRLRNAWMEARAAEGHRLVAAEIPLLFEAGLDGQFDVSVFVDAPAELRLERMIRQRGLDPNEARRIMAAQMDPAAKRARAAYVMTNQGGLQELKAGALELLGTLTARAEEPPP